MALKINRNAVICLWSYVISSAAWPLKLLTAHLFCNWKPSLLELCLWLMAMLMFQRFIYFTSISIARSSNHFNYLLLCIHFQKQPTAHAWGMQLCQKRDSGSGVFLWILWNFLPLLQKNLRETAFAFYLNYFQSIFSFFWCISEI